MTRAYIGVQRKHRVIKKRPSSEAGRSTWLEAAPLFLYRVQRRVDRLVVGTDDRTAVVRFAA